jgi:hypothetical protein
MKNSFCNNKKNIAGLQALALIMMFSPIVKSLLNQLGNENIIDFTRGIFSGIYIGGNILILRIIKNK